MAKKPLTCVHVFGQPMGQRLVTEELMATFSLAGLDVSESSPLTDDQVTALFASLFDARLISSCYRLVFLDGQGCPQREEAWLRHGIYTPGPARQLRVTNEVAVSPDGSSKLKVPQLKLRMPETA